jgi:hypothetical protein
MRIVTGLAAKKPGRMRLDLFSERKIIHGHRLIFQGKRPDESPQRMKK